MQNKELHLLKDAILLMRFETYGELMEIGSLVSKLDEAIQARQVRYNEVFAKYNIPIVNGQYEISAEVIDGTDFNNDMNEVANAPVTIDTAILSREQFDKAIRTTTPIPTELLILSAKYLVK